MFLMEAVEAAGGGIEESLRRQSFARKIYRKLIVEVFRLIGAE
jgi:hypothetical protein